jgi:hypothetical protein
MVWYGMVYVPQVMVRVFPPAHARVCENSLRLYSPHIIGPVAHGVGHFFGRCFGLALCDLRSPHRARCVGQPPGVGYRTAHEAQPRSPRT